MTNVPENEKGPQGPKSLLNQMKSAPCWLLRKGKVPYYASGKPRRGTLDTPEDRSQLVTHAKALEELDKWPGRYTGLGFALGPDGNGGYWQGIDVDKIIANELSDIAEHFRKGTLQGFGYFELSPSKEGVHLIGYGRQFNPLGSNGTGIEAYCGGRYFTVTGDEVGLADGTPSPHLPIDLADTVENYLAPRHSKKNSPPPSSEVPPLPSPSGNAVTVVLTPPSTDVQVNPRLVAELRSALNHIKSDDYGLWIKIGMALHELGDTGRGLWFDWSQTSEKYEARNAEKTWASFKPNKTGYKAVFAEAQSQGWVNPASKDAQLVAVQQPHTQPALSPLPSIPDWHTPRILFDPDLEKMPRLEWLVKGIIPTKGIGCIYGASGSYKSFLTLDLLAHIARGQEWFGKRVRAAHTVYIPFEGQGGVPNRIMAWRLAQARQADADAFHIASPPQGIQSGIGFIFDHINLQEGSGRLALINRLKASRFQNGVICIDTLAHAANGLDENSSEMNNILSYFKEIQIALDCLIIVIHHAGKDSSKGMRGWSGLHAAMDFVIECSRNEETTASKEKTAIFKIAKSKDSVDGAFFKFAAERIGLGLDDDGDSISSLVIRPLTDEDEADVACADEDQSATDEFVLERVTAELSEGRLPTGRSLEDQRSSWHKHITQNGLRKSLRRLLECGKLRNSTPKTPKGRTYLILGG